MTRAEVTRVVHIVFFLWLAVSIALALTTIVALLPLPDRRHGYEEVGSTRVSPANDDRQTESFPMHWCTNEPRSRANRKHLPAFPIIQEKLGWRRDWFLG